MCYGVMEGAAEMQKLATEVLEMLRRCVCWGRSGRLQECVEECGKFPVMYIHIGWGLENCWADVYLQYAGPEAVKVCLCF